MITKYRAIEGDLGRVVDALPGVVWTALTDGEIEFLSHRWSEYTGLGIDESRGRGWQAAVHPEDLPRLLAGWRSDAISSAPVEVEVRLRGPDGNYRWFLFRARPSTDAAGKVVKWCGLATDIDERMRAGNALREDQSRAEALLAGEKRLLEMVASGRPMADTLEALCRLVESTASGSYCSIILLDPSGSKLQESIAPSIAAEFRDAVRGWPVDRLGGPCQTVARDNIQVIMPDVESDDRWRNSWRALARKHGLRSCWSTPIVSRAGNVLGTFALYWNEPGSPNALQLELIAQFTNIASIAIERAQRDAALRESEARRAEAERELQLTIDSIPTLVGTYRPDGSRIFVNQTWRDYTGLTLESAREAERNGFVHPDDAVWVTLQWRESLATGVPFQGEMRLRRADGEYRWHLVHRVPARDDSGAIAKWYSVGADIEERKRAEQALRESEARLSEAERELRVTLDTIPVIVWRGAAANGYVQQLNKRWFEYTGTTPEQVRGRRWKQCIHPDDLERHVQIGADYVAAGTPIDSEARLRRFDGEYRRFLFRPAALRDETGAITGWYGTIIDIEDRKRAEEELRRSEALLAKAQRLSLTGSFSFNPVTEEGTWSDEVYRIYEFQPGTRSTLAMIRSRYHPDDLYLLEEQIARIHSGATDLDYEHRLLMPDGSIKHVHMVAQGSRGEDGGPFEYIGAVQDITQRRAAEEELRRSEAFLAKAQRLSLTGSFSFYSATGEFTWSDELYRIFEFEPGIPVTLELIRTRYHPEDRHVMEEVTEGIRLGAADFDYEHRLLMPDGSIKHIRVVAHGAPDKERGGTEYFGAVQDVTQPRVAEQGLRRSEAYLAEAQRLSHTGSWAVDYANRKPIHSSEEHHRLFGFDPADGMPPWRAWMDRIHPEDRDRTRGIIERSSREKTDLEMDYRICLPDGTVRYVHDVGHPVLNAAGDVVEFVGTSVDVTQRRLADEALDKARSELAHVTRVMSLGALTASIAHEVNQPLSGIITNASTCLRMLAADPPNIEGARMTAQRTIRDGNRAADVITRLRALFSKKAAATETVDLNEATREVLALVFSDLLRNRVFLRTELDDDNPLLVTGDRVQLQQVILNLVRNAVDAMRDVNDRPRHLLVRAESDADGRAHLVVKDAGVGLDAQAMERLFDPFYTTKDEGMGIGLSVSRSIIENHGGKLWAEANDGPGATFSFSIPRLTGNATGDRTGGEAWTPNLNGEHKAMRNS
jgi:PAS domain S-box-containing protein